MDYYRESELFILINEERNPNEMKPPLNKAEREYYNALIREKKQLEEEAGHKIYFEMPMESYDNIWHKF